MENYTYSELELGKEAAFTRTITPEDVLNFSKISGDENPLHLDSKYALSTKFKKPVVFGMLVASFLSPLAGMHLPGKNALILSTECNFKNPCFEGDSIKVSGKIKNKIDVYKIIVLQVKIENQKKETLIEGEMCIQVLK